MNFMKHYGIPVVHKDYIPEDLPDNTEADYRSHHKVWKSILDSSIHPGAKRFRNYLMGRLGTVKKNGQKKKSLIQKWFPEILRLQ